LKISTRELIASLPEYMVDLISSQILGEKASAKKLSESLCDLKILKQAINTLKPEDRDLLHDLYELGGQAEWSVCAGIYSNELDDFKMRLIRLGKLGFVFQGGLTGRDVVIMLPTLFAIVKDIAVFQNISEQSIEWKEEIQSDIHPHVLMINAIKAGRFKCRSGMELYKKDSDTLQSMIGLAVDVPRIYAELVALGCLEEKDGVVMVSSGHAMSLALDGHIHYGIWRFTESCKDLFGLHTKVFHLIKDGVILRKWLTRSMFLHIKQYSPEISDLDTILPSLLSLWIAIGVLEEDITKQWIRFRKDVYKTFTTGNVDSPSKEYEEEVIIQPTMEILVPMNFDPVDHLRFGEIADIEKADKVSIYRVTRESVIRGLRYGWTLESMEEFLERVSKHKIADNVHKTIKGWSNGIKKVKIVKGTFLIVNENRDKAQDLEEILPGVYRIPDKLDDDIIESLHKRGLMVDNPEVHSEKERGIEWKKTLPARTESKIEKKYAYPDGVYPYGMVIPLPYGEERVEMFEKAILEGRNLIIFYPKKGYGEIQMKEISPIYIYRQSGNFFLEAFCEDTGEGDVFDISKIKAIFKDEE
jgi:hypothetical protein